MLFFDIFVYFRLVLLTLLCYLGGQHFGSQSSPRPRDLLSKVTFEGEIFRRSQCKCLIYLARKQLVYPHIKACSLDCSPGKTKSLAARVLIILCSPPVLRPDFCLYNLYGGRCPPQSGIRNVEGVWIIEYLRDTNLGLQLAARLTWTQTGGSHVRVVLVRKPQTKLIKLFWKFGLMSNNIFSFVHFSFFVPRYSARSTRVVIVIIDVLLSAVTPQTTVNNVHNSCVCSNYSQGTRRSVTHLSTNVRSSITRLLIFLSFSSYNNISTLLFPVELQTRVR